MAKNMEDYIAEITSVYLQNLNGRKQLTSALIKVLKDHGIQEKELTIVASGSSHNAALCALPFLQKYIGPHTRLITPFEYIYYETVRENVIYLFVSQSGYSTNILKAVKEHKAKNRIALGITGNRASDLGKEADICFEYGVGEETVGYVTKGMSVLILFFMLLGLELSVDKSSEEYNMIVKDIQTAAKAHNIVYNQSKRFCLINKEKFINMKNAFLIAGGANMGTVSEGSLKISEMVHIQTTAYEIEEFIHGPDLQLTPEDTLFFTSAEDEAKKRIVQVYQAAKHITENAFLIQMGDVKVDQIYSPLYLTAFYQYLAFFVAREKGITSEHPLHEKFEQIVHCKSEGYTESTPF